MATTALSLEQKTNVEFRKLRLKLRNQLQKDILRLYSDSLFADVLINVENEVLKLHSCILQTRAPAFFTTYCQKPDLIRVVPCQKLKIFFKEIYCDTEIRSKEDELLKCIESDFPFEKSINFKDLSNFERSHYFSINDSIGSKSNTKLQLLKDISKSNSCVNYSSFRNSDNTIYYSLVDESLVLSDFSDINEETSEVITHREAFPNLFSSEMDETNVESHLAVDLEETHGTNDESVQAPSVNCQKVDRVWLATEKNAKSVNTTTPQKFFAFDGDDERNLNNEQSGRICKFFIDASDLIDEDTVKGSDEKVFSTTISSKTQLCRPPSSHDFTSESERNVGLRREKMCEKQTPDSLDDDPQLKKDCSTNPSPIDLQNKLENDFLRATLADKETKMLPNNTTSALKRCEDKASSLSSTTNPAVSFSSFKTYLTEKYECAKKNHAYTADELQRLKVFDDLVLQDDNFTYLKCDLEEIRASGASKACVAMHKFLLKQYGKHHGLQATYATVKIFMKQLLKQRDGNVEKKFDQIPDSLNGDDEVKTFSRHDGSTTTAEVEELFKKLVQICVPNERQTECGNTVQIEPEPVTSKSCGFFIDLKENSKPASETKVKSIPSKQLFSMFIDFGNSTDSDSSIEVHNKFERRKIQHISKLEKSRELRNSVTTLNDGETSTGGGAGGRNLERIVQSTPLSCGVGAAAIEKLLEETPVVDSTSTVMLRRARNATSTPHPQAIRRSWNVDRTNDIGRNAATKHKRSYSVSMCRPEAVDNMSRSVDANLNGENGAAVAAAAADFPSIGNADSTNELTVNGESEISNSRSNSEAAEAWRTPSSVSNSVSSAKVASKGGGDGGMQLKSDESWSKAKEKVFVKLSDMDKEPKTLSLTEQWSSVRMTKSAIGTETNWFETKLLNGSANSRSLSRIFPDLSASVLSKPNSDVDDTTVSSMSSVQSSSAVSTCESNLDLSNNASKGDNNTLGQDLLKMFLEEISTDVVVEVAGRRIKAHKCILTSRCQYFAALLSGGWVESAGNVLSIHGFSYNVVHFALCYIYSGESEIPENISIVELASLADYLCLEGLKEVVSCTLKMRYCHFFHKPCNICLVGVLECLPIAVNYGLDDIHRKSLRWITKHYVRLWCSKAFASLPRELIDKCYNQHVVNMTVKNVFETLTNCDKLFSFIPQTRWAEPCFAVTRRLHEYCIKFLANHFVEFLKSDAFMSIATNRTWGIIIMDEKTQLVCGKMRSEQLCQSYTYLSNQCKLATASHENEELIELLNRVKYHIETMLVKIALQACQCTAWFQMDPELRTHIQTSAGLTFIPSEVKRRVETFKPRPSTISSGSRGVDLQQVKTVINRQHRQANNNVRGHEPKSGKQCTNQKPNFHHSRSMSAKQNGSQNKENKGSSAKSSSHANSKSPFRNKYANVKSRYMEHKSGKNDRATASETTPSETSEAERRPPAANKRPSKSLASSVHLSPGTSIRQTARAVSLSKIPVCVRNSSQKRTESDRDTTSSSDNGLRSERREKDTASLPPAGANGLTNGAVAGAQSTKRGAVVDRRLASSRSTGGAGAGRSANVASSRASHAHGVTRKSHSSAGPTDVKARVNHSARAQSAAALNGHRKSMANGAAAASRREHVAARRRHNADPPAAVKIGVTRAPSRSKETSPDEKCRSNPSSGKTSISEELPRPDVPFRRDGTFCIDEPTVLKKNSPNAEQAADVI